MKKIIYLMFLAAVAFNFMSCEENDKQDEGTTWNYKEPYFEFEYATDTIQMALMPGQTMSIAVKDLKQMFLGMASSKMHDYFRGIDFYSADSLLIKAQMASGDPFVIHANYLKDDKCIEIRLDGKDMAALMGDKAMMIPAISFNYFMEGQQMTIYFNEIYVQSIFENVQIQNMLLPMLAGMLNPDFENMPKQAQQQMLNGIKKQISILLDNIQIMKIGFVLTK